MVRFLRRSRLSPTPSGVRVGSDDRSAFAVVPHHSQRPRRGRACSRGGTRCRRRRSSRPCRRRCRSRRWPGPGRTGGRPSPAPRSARRSVTPGCDGHRVGADRRGCGGSCTLRSRTSAGPSDFAGESGAGPARDQRARCARGSTRTSDRDVVRVFGDGDRERRRSRNGLASVAVEPARRGASKWQPRRGTRRGGRRGFGSARALSDRDQ